MSKKHLQPVVDLFTWSNGLGFRNAEDWWEYVANHKEQEKVELIMVMALLDTNYCKRLLQHDITLFQQVALSESTVQWLKELHAESIEELAECFLAMPPPCESTHSK